MPIDNQLDGKSWIIHYKIRNASSGIFLIHGVKEVGDNRGAIIRSSSCILEISFGVTDCCKDAYGGKV